MIKKITCIECPKGCALSVEVEGGKIIKMMGHECPKGEKYATTEIEDPTRILTSTVLAEGLSLKTVPVRTDQPIRKDDILKAVREIKKIRIRQPIRVGNIVIKDFLCSGTNLIATRDCD